MRRQRLQAASASALAQHAQQAAAVSGSMQQQQAAADQVTLQLSYPDGSSGSAAEPRVAVQLVVRPVDAAAGDQAPSDLSSALAAIAAAAGSGSDGSLDAQQLQQAAAALGQLARAQGVSLPGFATSMPPTRAASLDASTAAAASSGATAAAAAAADGGAFAAAALQEQCTQLQLQLGRMQAELEQAQQDAAFARDAAERKQQEMRGRFAEAQQRQGELLRVAQDSRLDAGGRLAGLGSCFPSGPPAHCVPLLRSSSPATSVPNVVRYLHWPAALPHLQRRAARPPSASCRWQSSAARAWTRRLGTSRWG